jgi:hypothetical protein
MKKKKELDFQTKLIITSYLASVKIALIFKEAEAREKRNIKLANAFKKAKEEIEKMEKEWVFAKARK